MGKIRLLHRSIQAGFGLFVLFVGYRFYLFFCWAMGSSDYYVARPPAVEGFLPISALLSLKRLLITGHYDAVHPAGLTIFIAALLVALLARKGFCGWICPVGLASHLADELGRRGRWHWIRLPKFLEWPLNSVKYLLLGFFVYMVFWRMDLDAIAAFQRMPYNLVADGKLLLFFLAPSATAAAILLFLLLVSFVVRNFWCRYLCPYGALLGIIALLGPLVVRREAARCIDCQKCDRVCPGAIQVSKKEQVLSTACVGCLECLAACPRQGCLELAIRGGIGLPYWVLPALLLALFLGCWLAALLSGHWHSSISSELMRQLYPLLGTMGHP